MKPLLLFSYLLCGTIPTLAQPDLSPIGVQSVIGKLITIASNSTSDGSELMDTITGISSYGSYKFISTVQYPGGQPATLEKDEHSWAGNSAAIRYTWECVLMSSKTKSAGSFLQEEIKLVNSINQVLPGNFPDSVTHTWKLKDGISIRVYRRVQDNYTNDRLCLYVSVNKKMTADKQENINRILLQYNTLIDNLTAGNLLQAYCKAAFFKVLIETDDTKEAATLIHPLLKKVADKDMRQAFNVLMDLPVKAPVPILTTGFTAAQKKMITDYARGVVTAFNNQQNGVPAAPATATYKPYVNYTIKQLYKEKTSKKYIQIMSFTIGSSQYTIRDCFWGKDGGGRPMMMSSGKDRLVDKDELDAKEWFPVSVGNCTTCGGSGVCGKTTSYSYSITETGIYNKYEISGTRQKTTLETCWGCSGLGMLEYYLR